LIPRILHITPTFNYTCGRSYYHYITFKHLEASGCYNYLLSKEGIAVERLKDLNIDYSTDKNIGSRNPIFITGLLKKIHSIVLENNINIIHTYSRATESLCLMYKSLYKKNIVTVNTVLSLVDNRYYVEYKSERLIAISRCVESQLINKFKIPKGRISLIYNYAEPYSGDSIRNNTNKDKLRILSAGRFHREKDFETLLKAINYLDNPNIEVTLVGSGKLKVKYQKYICENNLNVNLKSPVNDLTEYFLSSDVCVLPSLIDPLPTFMIQAGFFKRPFIGSDVDGISETIVDGTNGLLFDKGDTAGLAGKIMEFFRDSDLRRKCADNLFHLVYEKHNPVINVGRILDLYNFLIN